MVKRAEKAGFKAIVLTVDAPTFGKRLADVRNQFKMPDHLELANFRGMPEHIKKNVRIRDPSLTWEAISWLRSITNLPIVAKGVLHPEVTIVCFFVFKNACTSF